MSNIYVTEEFDTDVVWKMAKENKISATDAAIIHGGKYREWLEKDHPGETWQQALLAEKLNPGEDKGERVIATIGKLLEPLVLELASRELKGYVEPAYNAPWGIHINKEHDWRVASLDAMIGQERIVELKTGMYRHAESLLETYQAQCAWQSMVTGLPVTIVHLNRVNGDVITVDVERDYALEEQMIEQCTEFYNKYIVGDGEPAVEREVTTPFDD